MNEKIHWEKIGLLTVVMISVAVVAFVMGKSVGNNGQAIVEKAPMAQVIAPEKMMQTDSVYTNTKYGFSLTLPKSWKKVKISTKEVEIPEAEDSEQGISFGYALDQNDPKLGQVAYLYDIYIFSQADWLRVDHDILVKVGENDVYVFAFLPANGQLEAYGYWDYCQEHIASQQEFCTAYTDLKNVVSGPSPSEQLHFQTMARNIPEESVNGILYTNHEYDFQLTLPINWDGYSVKSRLATTLKYKSVCEDELDFSVPKYENVFSINVCPKERWTKLQKDAEYMANSQNIVLGESDAYVYVFHQGMLLAGGSLPENEPVLEAQLKAVDAIRRSFQTYWPTDN